MNRHEVFAFDVENFGIDPNYRINPHPRVYHNMKNIIYQPMVYELASRLGNKYVDIGCNNGDKWHMLKGPIIGIDHPDTPQKPDCHAGQEWKPCNLEIDPIPVNPMFYNEAVVICADVIEHLVNPVNLIFELMIAVENGATVLLSTPDRAKLGNLEGPPRNQCHVREWTMKELTSWIDGLFNIKAEYTFGCFEDGEKNTILLTLT